MSIESLQIKRNKNVYESKEQAVNGLNGVSNSLKDGEIVLSRYLNDDGQLETLIGVETVYNNENNIVFLDSFTDISGKEIKTSATTVTNDITVAGGPLAEYVKDKIPTISAGTNIQDLLFSLFCEELYPSISASNSKKGAVTASIKTPTVTLKTTTSVSNNASIEVGTAISATTISFNGNSNANVSASTVTGMTYGYSLNNDKSKYSDDNNITKQPTSGYVSTSIAKLQCTINNGFTGGEGFTLSGTNVASLSKSNYSLGVVNDGTNRITVAVTGQQISYSISGISSVYPCSNLGNTKADCKTTAVDAVSTTATTAPSTSTTFTINGVRYGFHGKVDESDTIDSAKIRTLTNKMTTATANTITVSGTSVIKYIVAIPQTWNRKITHVKNNANQYEITGSYSLSSTSVSVTDASGGNAKAYDIYIYTSAIADEINHTITLGNK